MVEPILITLCTISGMSLFFTAVSVSFNIGYFVYSSRKFNVGKYSIEIKPNQDPKMYRNILLWLASNHNSKEYQSMIVEEYINEHNKELKRITVPQIEKVITINFDQNKYLLYLSGINNEINSIIIGSNDETKLKTLVNFFSGNLCQCIKLINVLSKEHSEKKINNIDTIIDTLDKSDYDFVLDNFKKTSVKNMYNYEILKNNFKMYSHTNKNFENFMVAMNQALC